jgi:hypothetical protein
MKIVLLSNGMEVAKTPNTDISTNQIHIFTQFFIHKNASRNEELRYCLKQNHDNPYVAQIHLLNERIYTDAEMGLTSSHKVRQENIGKRLSFQSVFQYIREQGIKGYYVLLNADIFLDHTIKYLLASTIHEKKQAIALLRYEFNTGQRAESLQQLNPLGDRRSPGDFGTTTDTAPMFGPRFDSQDTWIYHSNFPLKMCQEKLFAFDFGRPGCDNKFVYLMRILGYQMFNDPKLIKTYHFHRSIMRDYFGKDVISPPWGALVPAGVNVMAIPPSIGINIAEVCRTSNGFQNIMYEDHTMLYDYVADKLSRNEPFVIPRIAGIENNVAVFARLKQQTGKPDFDGYFQSVGGAMKNNAGILLTNFNSIMKYSDLYLKSFDNCDLYSGWEVQGDVYKHIAQSHEFIRGNYPNKRIFWAFALDIFHYIYDPKAWTKSLRGKRILIVSAFEESIKERVPKRAQLYDGVDLFPDCTFVYIRPPQTQAGEPSREFDVELEEFQKRLDVLKDSYDVALVSCGGYGNLVCNYIFEKHRKSAVYVGGVLQMYFGVLGNRWLKERPDVVRLFLNEHWSRPKTSERPRNCDTIENSCYW